MADNITTAAPADDDNTPKKLLVIDPEKLPTEVWSLENLEKNAMRRYDAIQAFARKSCEELWAFGLTLSLIKEKRKRATDGIGWMRWVEGQPFSMTTANNAIRFHQRVPLGELHLFTSVGVSEAKELLGIIRGGKVASKAKRGKGAGSVAEGGDDSPADHKSLVHKETAPPTTELLSRVLVLLTNIKTTVTQEHYETVLAIDEAVKEMLVTIEMANAGNTQVENEAPAEVEAEA